MGIASVDARRADAFVFSQPESRSATELITFRSARPARRVAVVGNYVPRKCGIATFTADLTEQLARFRPEIDVDVWALDDAGDEIAYQGVAGTIDRADTA